MLTGCSCVNNGFKLDLTPYVLLVVLVLDGDIPSGLSPGHHHGISVQGILQNQY